MLIEPGTFKTEIFESNREVAAGARNPASPYYQATRHLEKKVDELVARHGADPQKVADAILFALTTPRPRLRYLVGIDAQISGRLPAALSARMMASVLGLAEARRLLAPRVA